jgi:hypothetical protein
MYVLKAHVFINNVICCINHKMIVKRKDDILQYQFKKLMEMQ